MNQFRGSMALLLLLSTAVSAEISSSSPPELLTGDALCEAQTVDGRSAWFTKQEQRGGTWTCTVTVSYKQEDGTWSPEAPAPFSGTHFDETPSPSPDGRKVFFTSMRSISEADKGGLRHLWMVEKTDTGWGAPVNLAVLNGRDGEIAPWVTAGGNLYFSSGRKIFVSEYKDGRYTQPAELDEAVNHRSFLSYNAWVSPDETVMIFGSVRSKSAGGFGQEDVYISTRENGRWTPARNAGPLVNTDQGEYGGCLSRDGRSFAFSSSRGTLRLDAGDVGLDPKAGVDRSSVHE